MPPRAIFAAAIHHRRACGGADARDFFNVPRKTFVARVAPIVVTVCVHTFVRFHPIPRVHVALCRHRRVTLVARSRGGVGPVVAPKP